ncbi:DUF3137 domain-containing protein [bacterium]|nr:DUF3137 domain-containing protein [bacterium]
MYNIKKDFNGIYIKEIFPILNYLEPVRQKKLQEFKIMKYTCIAIGLLTLLIPKFAFTIMKPLGLTTGMGALLGVILFAIFVIPIILGIPYLAFFAFISYKKRTKNEFKKIIKENCLSKVLSHFDNLKYKDQEIPRGLFEDSGLFANFDIIKCDDAFTGKYKDIWFHVEELLLYQTRAVAFRGVAIVFPVNKTVKTPTIIATRNDTNINNLQPNAIQTFIILFAILCIMIFTIAVGQEIYHKTIMMIIIILALLIHLIFDTISKTKKLKSVKLEDISFDKRFTVYSKDQIEARYLVTPAFMDRLYKLQTAFGAKDIKCSFFGNKVMFAISTDKDLFEFGNLFTPLNNSENIYQFIDELTSIYNIIDHFKLNEKTGL